MTDPTRRPRRGDCPPPIDLYRDARRQEPEQLETTPWQDIRREQNFDENHLDAQRRAAGAYTRLFTAAARGAPTTATPAGPTETRLEEIESDCRTLPDIVRYAETIGATLHLTATFGDHRSDLLPPGGTDADDQLRVALHTTARLVRPHATDTGAYTACPARPTPPSPVSEATPTSTTSSTPLNCSKDAFHLHAAFADATVELLRGPDESETDEAEAESNA